MPNDRSTGAGGNSDALAGVDLASRRRWLEQAAQHLFPTGCVVAVRTYRPAEPADSGDGDCEPGRPCPQRQREFAAGRAAAKDALEQLGVPDTNIPIGPDRSPLWPEGCVGSISHTAGLALAVAARREHLRALGLDLELSRAVTPELWTALFGASEIGWIQGRPNDQQAGSAAVIFCAKESFYKLQYPMTGAWVDFHDAEVAVFPDTGSFRLVCAHPAVTTAFQRSEFPGRFAVGAGLTLATMQLPHSLSP